MKRLILLLVVLTAIAASAQEPLGDLAHSNRTNMVEKEFLPTYSDLNCAGFISNEKYNPGNYLMAGAESPAATQFGQRDTVFLEGSGYAAGQRYSILRALKDPNRYPPYIGQRLEISKAGQPYQEMGHVLVTAIRGNKAIATVEFNCTPMVAGDLVVPFIEKEPVHFRKAGAFERFPTETASITGQIMLAKDFDVVVGTGAKVYLNVGSSQGVKIGDYFRAVRSYDPAKQDPVEALSFKVPQSEDTMKKQAKIPNSKYAELPKRALGEMIVLSVTPTSATAMITNVVEHINVGDLVEIVSRES